MPTASTANTNSMAAISTRAANLCRDCTFAGVSTSARPAAEATGVVGVFEIDVRASARASFVALDFTRSVNGFSEAPRSSFGIRIVCNGRFRRLLIGRFASSRGSEQRRPVKWVKVDVGTRITLLGVGIGVDNGTRGLRVMCCYRCRTI